MRKKIFTFLLALVTSVGMMYAWTSGDCEVTLNEGVVTVSGPGAMGNYTYFTQTPWYSSRNSITSIIIEDGVTNVGDYAFMRLDNLQSVVIGNNVVTIGSHAFEQCGSSFTSLTLGNSIVEIGEQAFINNSRITSINLPNTLQTIGEDAFYGCTRISSLTIPSSVTSIGDYAFGGCSLIAYIIAEPTTPPSTEENTFISIVAPSYIPLYVPNGSVADYTAAERWNTFNIQGYDPSTGPTIEPVPATPNQLSGAFTINGDGDQINFSKGNLQYVGSWQFAENQWNIIGNDQADDNRDLFGWGTGDAPNKVSTTLADYAEYHEWGTNMGDGWYTLSKDEWTYLFQSRTNAANLYAPAKVNGVNGFVVLPDEFTLPSGLSFTAGVTNYGTNFYANAAWRAMENAGAVFLPVDGYRYDGNKIKWVGQSGFYWSSTVASAGASAWSWLISASDGARRDYYNLHYGMCVRLVKAVDKPDQDYADPVIALINAIGTVEYTQVCKNRIVEARAAYDHLTDAQKALVSNYSTLTDAEEAYAALTPPPATDGSLSGAFTINAYGDQINFSKGNLQYVGSWQFAANQWNIIGAAQADDNRDLFGWGTGDAPNKVSMTLADYAEYHEWGTNMGDGWYTLSRDEWTYLFQTRTNAANLYAPANVNGVKGFVVLPDEWVQPYGTTFTPGVTNYGTNVYADAAWTSMEDAGAVFLPVAGYRYNGNINWVGQSGFYWSSTVASEGASAWSWLISASDGARRDYYNLYYGMPVRLVKAAAPSGGSTPSNACGDGLTWELSEGVLTISYDGEGTGEMTDFDYEYESPVNVAPWKENKSDITTVVIGDGVKSIGNHAFNDLGENFTAVTIANSVERIGLSAFMNAKWVTEMTLPSALQTIDKEGLANCGFSSITIPSGVTSIGNKAFCYCTALTSLTCEATTPPTLGSSVFSGISGKQNIPLYVPFASVSDYQAASQWNAFNIQAIPGGGSTSASGSCGDGLTWELNDSVLTISYDGVGTGEMTNFDYENESPVNVAPWKEYKSEITTVVIGDGVKSIGNHAFNDLSENFTAVTIANSVERIGLNAFLNSEEITEITLPSSLKTIDEQGFANCGFTSITIPSGVTSIGYKAFCYCRDLTSLTCEATTPPTLASSVFYKIRSSTSSLSSIPLYVPSGSVTAYEAAAQWNDFDIRGYDPAPAVTNYTVSLDIAENADKVTISAASAEAGETITVTPAAGYQITSLTASYASAYSVRVTADPNVDVYEATPYVGALPKEFTENVTPGLNGATFHSIEGNDPFTPVPASVLEYVGMNAAKDQMTIRVNDAFSGIIRVNYTYNVETCEWDEYEQQEICMGGTAVASVRVVCEAAGGVAPASKDDVTGAYSFTMPAGNVTITATVEAIPAPTNACGDGLTWELNDGVLTISYDGEGTGVMDDWGGYNEAPWSSEKLQITSVVLPEGITTIGSAAFRGCTNLASVNMAENFPASLTTIKTEAFYNSALTSVTIPANVVSIYSNVFYGCQSIANVYCYANPNDLVWMDGYCDDFKSGNKITQCHVKNCYLSLYNTKWNTGYELTDVNVTFVGDLPGDCGSSTFIDADFAINFMNDPYIVVGGGDLPEGVLVEGIPNKDLNHGYYNVIITIPAKAGTYKVTLGTCGFGLGNGTIKNENGSTTYASFNQHLADNDLCYHQDPTNNIVTAIFTLPEDQNIIVDCGEYTPYFSIEASSAPAPSYIDADFAIDFRHNPYEVVGGGSLPTGVEVSGTPNGDISHGYTGAIITIPVTAGNYKVTMGTCTYSNHDGFVKTEDGSHTYATLATNNGTCYHQNTATNVVSEIFNVPTDQIIKVHGAEYTPYFAIEKMAAVPAFTDFEISFQSNPYDVISGAKPEGTVIAGSFHDGDHGYQNVEVTVPMEAGTYRLTMGACQFGNGAGNVMSAANAELASFNQNLGENKCYHQNPSANIVSVTFTVDIDQNITINGGAYVPYMKLEKISAYAVEFALGDAEGVAPAAVDVTIGEEIAMPVNKTMYKDGYTLTGWSDGVNTYPIGESFTPANDVILTPVFTANEADLLNASTDVTVKWYFGGDNGAPVMHLEGSAGLLVAQATIGDKTVDVKLGIDATSGKFVPQPTTEWAQVRVGTIFTYPYKEGMTVDVHTYSGNVTYYIADGNVTCGTNDYYSYIELTFPAPASTAVEIGDPNDADQVNAFLTTYDGQTIDELIIDRPVYNNMYNTLCLPFDMNAAQIAASSLNGVIIREFTGASVVGQTLELAVSDPVNAVVAGRPYFVQYSAASQLDDLHFEGVTINNAVLDDEAVTFDGVTFKGTFTPFVMPNGLNFQGGYLFLGQNNQLFWPNTTNPLKPFRAYFYVDVEASTPGNAPKYRGMPARIVEGKNVATGVENAQSANQSTKVIVNGQLIIIKNDVRYNAQGQIVK